MKIAVPVADEQRTIFTRVGRAPWFALFEGERFVELRPNLHSHTHGQGDGSRGETHRHGSVKRGERRGAGQSGGSPEAPEEYSAEEVELHRKDLGNIADVDILLCRAVGPNMKEALELSGITVVKIRKKDGEKADEVVRKYRSSLSA